MSRMTVLSLRRVLTLGAAVLAAASGPARADFERTFTLNSNDVQVVDLIGAVRVERASGTKFEVLVQVKGSDADEKWIQIDSQDGSRGRVVVRFPVEEYRKYTYPPMGHSRSSFSMDNSKHDGEFLHEILKLARGERIEVSGRSSGKALEVWADVTVRVPAGKTAQVHLGCGTIDANNVEGDLDLRTRSGSVTGNDLKGNILIDTGSGEVDARKVRGDLDVDTGSGSVKVSDVRDGKTVNIDTGSGDVDVNDVVAKSVHVDTGSGGVDLRDVDADDVAIDTGSGGVDGAAVAANDLKVDTGSGGVEFELVKMGSGRYEIETGSGGVRLDMPRTVSARFDVETGAGSIDADLDGVTLSRRERQSARFKVGSGDATVHVTTGSGSIHLTQDAGTASRR